MVKNREYVEYLKGFTFKIVKTVSDSKSWTEFRLERNRRIKEICRRLNILEQLCKKDKSVNDIVYKK